MPNNFGKLISKDYENFLVHTLNHYVMCVVIQRRYDGSITFNRTWLEYKHGFGNPSTEYWLGNAAIHALTSTHVYNLMINLSDSTGRKKYAAYDIFSVDDESDFYRLHVHGYSGTAGDDFSSNNLANFSTFDWDHDTYWSNCAGYNGGGWWYRICSASHLNEHVIKWTHFDPVPWLALKTSTMMIRKSDGQHG